PAPIPPQLSIPIPSTTTTTINPASITIEILQSGIARTHKQRKHGPARGEESGGDERAAERGGRAGGGRGAEAEGVESELFLLTRGARWEVARAVVGVVEAVVVDGGEFEVEVEVRRGRGAEEGALLRIVVAIVVRAA